MSGNGQGQQIQKRVMISTSGPAAEIPDGTDGCAVKCEYERNWGFLKMVVPDARNDQTSSKTQVLGPVQDSDLTVGPHLIGASPVWGPMHGSRWAASVSEHIRNT